MDEAKATDHTVKEERARWRIVQHDCWGEEEKDTSSTSETEHSEGGRGL